MDLIIRPFDDPQPDKAPCTEAAVREAVAAAQADGLLPGDVIALVVDA